MYAYITTEYMLFESQEFTYIFSSPRPQVMILMLKIKTVWLISPIPQQKMQVWVVAIQLLSFFVHNSESFVFNYELENVIHVIAEYCPETDNALLLIS